MSVSNRFLIDKTEFGIGSVTLSIDPSASTFTLEIVGDEAIAANIGAADTHPFNWIIYPPKFYVRAAVFTSVGGTKTLDIDEDALDEYDIALYLIEHNDVMGTLTISAEGQISVVGTTSINGKTMPLEILTMA